MNNFLPEGVTEIPHTADLKIAIKGNTLEDIFKKAAAALAGIVAGKIKGDLNQEEAVKITSGGADTLLADFLNEIISRTQIKRVVYPEIEILELYENRAEIKLKGVRVDNFQKDIKAATYHGVKIERRNGKLMAEILFDV
jgi:SHS2 domain-containing protein